MVDQAPTARVKLLYKNRDITRDVSGFVKSIEFTDGLDKADDLQITLADPQRLWIRTWAPTKGATLELKLYSKANGVESALPCGMFHLDTCGSSERGQVVTLKATSADLTTSLRREDKTRAWEHASLSRILSDIAGGVGLQLQYLGNANPVYKRIEQRKESDLAFVTRIARNEDLLVKVRNGKLVITPPSDYETKPPMMTLSIDDPRILNEDLESQIIDAYSKVVVKYRIPQKHKLIEYTYAIPGAPKDGPTLHINKRCESVAHAERVAKSAIGRNHRSLSGGTITLIGQTSILAGVNIELDSSWGIHAGKYSIPEVTHRLWPFETELKPQGLYTVE